MGGDRRHAARPGTGSRAVARREQVAVELANAQMIQALRFSELVEPKHIEDVYNALLSKAVEGNLQAIKEYLNRVTGPEVIQIEKTEIDVASLLQMAMTNQEEAEIIDVELE